MPHPPSPTPPSPRLSSWLVAAMLGMVAVPAYFTLRSVHITAPAPALTPNPSPYGYTVSLLLFLIPVVVIAFWFLPQEGVKVSKKSFWWTFAILFPLGALLDFLFAGRFFLFPNPGATLGIPAPALVRPVPIEEYVFYFTGFLTVLLLYIWFDEYWFAAYNVPITAAQRSDFRRLLRFHPESLLLAIALIAAAILYRRFIAGNPSGFPGYFIFLTIGALTPSAALLPATRSVINWRALSLTMFMLLLVSLLWEVTLALPYGWWGFQDRAMLGLYVTAWARLPIEEVVLWITVTYASVIVYETVKQWQGSGKSARHAFLGKPKTSG